MAPFEELQQIWKDQPQPFAVPLDVRGTLIALAAFRRRQNIINVLKACLILFMIGYFASRQPGSLLIVCGGALIVAGSMNLLIGDWRNQMGITRLDFSSPSLQFIDQALARLDDPNAGLRRRLWLNILLICAGINLANLSDPPSGSRAYSLLMHLASTAAILIALAVGLKIHAVRMKLEYRPIRRRLLALKLAIDEENQ